MLHLAVDMPVELGANTPGILVAPPAVDNMSVVVPDRASLVEGNGEVVDVAGAVEDGCRT
jgi:hypothetical protein